LTSVLGNCGAVTLAVLKDGLMMEATPLSVNNQICIEFAQILKQNQIATVTFEKDLDELELIRFLLLIGADRQEVDDQGGIEAAAEACNLSKIILTAVDYSKLHLTEEHEIQRSGGQEQDASVWQQFVSHILAVQSSESGKSEHESHNVLNPFELAGLLNQDQLDVRLALKQYDEILSEVAHHHTEDLLPSEGLQKFQEMIKELKPDLRKQFLSATLAGCETIDAKKGVDQFVEGLGADLIVQMIRQANSEGREISPSLLSFVKRMGHLGIPPMDQMASKNGIAPSDLSSEHVDSLLAHEQYDHYVDEDYGILLDSLAVEKQWSDSTPSSQSLSQELAESLTEMNICCHVVRAMVGLMTQSSDSEGYRSWARQLSYILGDLLNSQAYDCLTETLTFVVKERGNQDQEKAKIADVVWDQFNSPEFVAEAVERIMKSDRETTEQGLHFLVQLGEPVVVEIMDLLSAGKTNIDRGKLIQTLDKFGHLAAWEAVERLNDSRLNYLRMMIQTVRRLGDKKSAGQLRSLLEHDNIDIRMEALGTLLRFNNRWGLIRLRELINAPWSDITRKSVELAGIYKVADVVSILISFAQRRGDAPRQEASIRALGNIGDARAIPILDKLARRRWTMSKKHQMSLNRVIFESLDGYETAAIIDLLHFGIKQKDDHVQSICETMLRQIRMNSQ
jgi:hypothetical protein